MDSCNSWSPSPLIVEPRTALPSVSALQGRGLGSTGVMDGQSCSSAVCSEGEEDEDEFSLTGSMKASVFLSLSDPPQSSDAHIHDTLCTVAKLSYAQEEMPAMTSPSESTNCSGIGLAKRAKIEQSGLPCKAPPISQSQACKLGEKITALQQLVSPFGKTDTASVLLEAIGYIKFLQDQVHVLSSPYMISNSSRKECQSAKELRSRGLCLVPVSCTLKVASSNGADYWISGISGCSR